MLRVRGRRHFAGPLPPPPLALPVPCCVDLPSGAPLVRHALAELLRGLGAAPVWTRCGDARLVLATDGPDGVTTQALGDLAAPRVPEPAELGWIEIDGERWPVPVGPPGSARLADALVSAAWWLAGLQEAAITARDPHGRVPFAATLQAQLGDAPGAPLRPAVDALRRLLADALRQRGVDLPGRTWGGAPWAVALTHDLDAVRTRRVRAGLAELAHGQLADAAGRAFGPDRRRQSIRELRELGDKHGARASWFVKPGAWSPEDVPGGLDPSLVRRLRTWRGDGDEVGWHPGYGAHDHPARLAAEVQRFASAFGPPRLARTHFLRWSPATPGLLAAHGVEVDSTLGWSQQPGFRHGTAHPFRLWDAGAERAGLWEMPLAVMDTTLANAGLDANAVAGALRQTFDAARQSGGVAVVLWHNQVGAGTAAWTARLDALDRELGRAAAGGARLGPLGALLDDWTADP